MNFACSSQKGCSRVALEKSRLGPAEEIARNVFFMMDELQTAACSVKLSARLQSGAQLFREYDGSQLVVALRLPHSTAEPASRLVLSFRRRSVGRSLPVLQHRGIRSCLVRDFRVTAYLT